MSTRAHEDAELTKNQSLVLAVLSRVDGPLTAYNLLDELREHGFRAPLQVYRALEKLIELGRVHRLESLNAFVACRHPDCDASEVVAFTICETCGNVSEISDDTLAGQLRALAQEARFALKKSIVELRGICRGCQNA